MQKFCVNILFCKHYFSPLNTFLRKGKDPDPYLWLMDPGGPKTCGSCGSGSGSPTLPWRTFLSSREVSRPPERTSSSSLFKIIFPQFFCEPFYFCLIRCEISISNLLIYCICLLHWTHIEVGGSPEDEEEAEDEKENGDEVEVPVQLQRVPRLWSWHNTLYVTLREMIAFVTWAYIQILLWMSVILPFHGAGPIAEVKLLISSAFCADLLIMKSIIGFSNNFNLHAIISTS